MSKYEISILKWRILLSVGLKEWLVSLDGQCRITSIFPDFNFNFFIFLLSQKAEKPKKMYIVNTVSVNASRRPNEPIVEQHTATCSKPKQRNVQTMSANTSHRLEEPIVEQHDADSDVGDEHCGEDLVIDECIDCSNETRVRIQFSLFGN